MRTRNITSFIYTSLICVIIIGAAALALKPRFTDLGLAYDYVTSQMFHDFSSLTETTVKPDEKIKDPGAEEYKKRLASIDPNVRLEAIKSIEEKSYVQFIPQIIRLLNDNTIISGRQSSETFQISQSANSALTKMMKDHITRDPGNVALLLPLFQTGLKGSVPEKEGVLKTLSALRDPASYAFLKHLSESHADPQIASVASRVLDTLGPHHHTSTEYLSDFFVLDV